MIRSSETKASSQTIYVQSDMSLLNHTCVGFTPRLGILNEILKHASDHGSHIDGLSLIMNTNLSIWADKR